MQHQRLLLALALLALSACGPSGADIPNVTPTAALDERLAALETRLGNIEKQISPSASPSAASAELTKSVPAADNNVKELKAQPSSFNLKVNEESKLDLVLMTLNDDSSSILTSYDLLTLSSSDSEVVSIDSKGKIKALKVGVAALQVKFGGAVQSLPVVVTAAEASPSPTPSPSASASASPSPTPTPSATPASQYKSLTVSPDNFEVLVGGSKTIASLVLILNDADETPATLNNFAAATWTTSDSAVVAVNNGTVTGISVGSATVTVTYKGVSDTITVTVKAS